MTKTLVALLDGERARCLREGLTHPLIDTLAAETIARTRDCGRSF